MRPKPICINPAAQRREFCRAASGVLFCALAASALLAAPTTHAQQAPRRAPPPAELAAFTSQSAPWRMLGTGALRFFGFKAYDASLWVMSASTDPLKDKATLALDIEYNTALKAEEIVNVSLVEMARLRKASEAQIRTWTAQMQKTFPAVQKGDKLLGVHLPTVGARFFFNGKLIAEINDPAFSEAFFAIWLDPATKRPELRSALLGAGQAVQSAPMRENN